MTVSLRLNSLILGKFDVGFGKLAGRSSRCSCKKTFPAHMMVTACRCLTDWAINHHNAQLIQTSPGRLQVHVFHRRSSKQTIKSERFSEPSFKCGFTGDHPSKNLG